MFRRRKNSWSWHLSRHAFSFLDRDVFAHVTKQYLVRLLATMLATLCNFLPPRSKICTHCALSMPLDRCMSFSNLLLWWMVVVLVVLSGGAIFCYCHRRFLYAVAAACEYGSLIMVDVTSWYTPPSTLTKLNTFFMLLLMPTENCDSWLLMYSLKVSLFHRPIF